MVGDGHRTKLAAFITSVGWRHGNFRLGIHALPKLSAIAMALRMAMDLLIVS